MSLLVSKKLLVSGIGIGIVILIALTQSVLEIVVEAKRL